VPRDGKRQPENGAGDDSGTANSSRNSSTSRSRRSLQDCLGLAREDFGPSSGIVLFERADALVERADRLEERGELPFIVVDACEPAVETPILQFPLWLAFVAGPGERLEAQDYA
jgi:hypothetical protein